jgi:hypothetical protein
MCHWDVEVLTKAVDIAVIFHDGFVNSVTKLAMGNGRNMDSLVRNQ